MQVSARVIPGSRKDLVEKESSGKYRIKVRESAVQNLANQKARQLLSEHLGLKPEAVRLVAGHRGQNKKFEVSLKVKE